ncbi:GLD1 [Auxenochlorella protothecoides x Auxenochlorella symbiontica]
MATATRVKVTEDESMLTSLVRRITSSSERDGWQEPVLPGQLTLTIVVAGASGDLAKKKTYPALCFLYQHGFLCSNVRIVGYARTDLSDQALRDKLRPFLKNTPEDKREAFLATCSYVSGPYDTPHGWQRLAAVLDKRESATPKNPAGRLFYLALPPSVYPQVCRGLKEHCSSIATSSEPGRSWVRVVVEKPFGKDLQSSEDLAEHLGELYPEEQLYRIDHYLGKEMTQNMFVMRFANTFLSPLWSRTHVANVQITFKEDFGTQGRGGYFDEFGIIRDVIQNHLIQLLAFVGMEKPVSLHPDDIRDQKVQVLRCIKPPSLDNVVLGQYTAANGEDGYLEDPTVPQGSRTPTFASIVLYIDNDRWAGVPFIIKAGKALDERKAEIRIQLHETPHFIFAGESSSSRNELVVRLQPDEAIYMKFIVKKPGLDTEPVISELDLDYHSRYPDVIIPDAYPKLILDAIRGDQQHFVRRDELRAAWAIFTPLLHAVDAGEVPIHPYPYSSRGPEEADALRSRVGWVKNSKYDWKAKVDVPARSGSRL